jgi:hypothetical protein
LRPKVRPPLIQELEDVMTNQRVLVVLSPKKCSVGTRFENPRKFLMKLVGSWAKIEINLILRFLSYIKKELTDYITLALVPAILALKTQIATEKNAKHTDMMSIVSEICKKHVVRFVSS